MRGRIKQAIDEYVEAHIRYQRLEEIAATFCVNLRTLSRWRNEDDGTIPDRDTLRRIALVTGWSMFDFLQDLGYFDRDVLGLALREGETLTSIVKGIRRVEDLQGSVGINGGRLGAAVAADGWWDLVVVPTRRRLEVRGGFVDIHTRDHIGFARPGDDQPAGDQAHVPEILERYGAAVAATPAMPEDYPEIRAELTARHPTFRTWFAVNRLVEPIRPPDWSTAVDLGPVETIFALGTHYGGHDDVGALLADALGWGYLNTSFICAMLHGREVGHVDPDRRRLAQARHDRNAYTVAEAAATTGQYRRHVIALGNPNVLPQVATLLELPRADQLLVFCGPGKGLAEQAEQDTRGRPDEVKAKVMDEQAGDALRALAQRRMLVLRVEPRSNLHDYFEQYVDQFVTAYRWLMDTTGAGIPVSDNHRTLVERRL